MDTMIMLGIGLLGILAVGFMPLRDMYYATRPDRMVARLIDQDGNEKTYSVKFDEKGFTIGNHHYDVAPGCFTRGGMFRQPRATYFEGIADPVNIRSVELESGYSSRKAKELTENHTAREVIDALGDEMLSPTTTFFILVGVMVVGFGLIYFTINQKLDSIIAIVGGGGA